MKSLTAALAITSTLLVSPGWADETLFLLERKIPLGEVRGRIDHLAVDLGRNRLFVAELENDTVAVIDLDANKVMQVISGLNKPQGLGYHAATDTLYSPTGAMERLRFSEGMIIGRSRASRWAPMPTTCAWMQWAIAYMWHTAMAHWRPSIRSAEAKSPISS